MTVRPVEILVVEDNAGDVDLIREAFHDLKILNTIHVVENGEEAMSYLRREGQYASAHRPDLVLLDLNLPKKDGREVLIEIKSDQRLKTIPVVVPSTSDAELDVIKSYNLGANCYVSKPIGLEKFLKVMESIGEFWFHIVKLPSQAMEDDHLSRPNEGIGIRRPPYVTDGHRELRVLVIEDNEGDFEFIKELLSESRNPSYTVVGCDRLEKAIDLLSHQHFDVALLDLGLPDGQGLQTYLKLASCHPSVPIVISTGLDDHDLALKAIRSGAEDYISKGDIEGRMLSRVIQYAIERKWYEEMTNNLLIREQQARADAERAINARDEFLGIASHELKTPITSLRLQAQLLTRLMKNDNQAQNLQKYLRPMSILDSQTERLVNLMDNLLDISRINAGKLLLNLTTVNLSEIVQDVLERLHDQLEHAHCQVTYEGPPQVIGEWDRFRIEQMVTNLLTNAMKYGQNGPIVVKVNTKDNSAYLSVRDYGIGIKQEDLTRIFSRFERVTPNQNIQGLGLGLYIVHQIINAHHGKIKVESELGKGATFTIELPLKNLIISS